MVCISAPYEKGNIFNKDPMRPRKLLTSPDMRLTRLKDSLAGERI